MKTKIVYVAVSSHNDFFLEELWASLYSLRQFAPPTCEVVVLSDAETAERIKCRPALYEMINELNVIQVPSKYSNELRSRVIKTNIRNLVDGDFLFIDTDTIICDSLESIDNLNVTNLAMVPELHGPFKEHIYFESTWQDVKRIFGVDVSDSPYWFNSGCMLVKDNEITRRFFTKWLENWNYSAIEKKESSDQRALLKTDKEFGYIIECLPDIYNSQVAMTIQYFFDAKIVHFWHMRSRFTSDVDYSPFCNKEIYQAIRNSNGITDDIAYTIRHCKSSFRSPSMIVGKKQIYLLYSSFFNILGRKYIENSTVRKITDRFIRILYMFDRIKEKMSDHK